MSANVTKTKRPKKPYEMTHVEKIAHACKCSEVMVRLVLADERNPDTELGQSIMIMDALIKEQSENLLLQAVRLAAPKF